MFIVDGDIQIHRSTAEGYLKAGKVNQRQALWLLSDDVVKDITVFIYPHINADWQKAIHQTIADWNSVEGTKVNFRVILYDPNPDAVINTQFELPMPGKDHWIARASYSFGLTHSDEQLLGLFDIQVCDTPLMDKH